jgi:hypothetical protein
MTALPMVRLPGQSAAPAIDDRPDAPVMTENGIRRRATVLDPRVGRIFIVIT